MTYVSIDKDKGKEKKISNNFLVTTSNVKEAYDRIQESLSDMTVTFEVPSIMITPIVEVLPYNPDLDVELGRRPLEEGEELVNTSAEEEYEEDEALAESEDLEEEVESNEDEDNVSFKDETN